MMVSWRKKALLDYLREITYQGKLEAHRSIHRYPDMRSLRSPAVCNQGNIRTARRTDNGTRFRFCNRFRSVQFDFHRNQWLKLTSGMIPQIF